MSSTADTGHTIADTAMKMVTPTKLCNALLRATSTRAGTGFTSVSAESLRARALVPPAASKRDDTAAVLKWHATGDVDSDQQYVMGKGSSTNVFAALVQYCCGTRATILISHGNGG